MEANTRIIELRQRIAQHNHAYYVLNTPGITDAEYDLMYQELQALEQEFPELVTIDSPTQRVGGLMIGGFVKVPHRRKMLSLDNRYTAQELLDSFAACTEVLLEPKIDGASLKIVYESSRLSLAVTRGNGHVGNDVTANARTMPSIPLSLRTSLPHLEVVGEVYMKRSALVKLNELLEAEGADLFANTRNAASGSLMLKDPKECARRNLMFVAHGCNTEIPGVTTMDGVRDFLKRLGFQTTDLLPKAEADAKTVTRVLKLAAVPALEALLAEADIQRKKLDVDTDGLVFKVNDLADQADLGEGNKFPHWAFAYKFPPERRITTLLGVTMQVGKTGRITPVAELKAVSLSGTVVQRASLCNQDEIKRLNVNIGDSVYVEKSAEIIPKVMGVAKKQTEGHFILPAECPCCQTQLVQPEGFVDWYCPNSRCSDQVYARLRYAVGKDALDMKGVGGGMLRVLMDTARIARLSDLFALEDEAILLKPAARRTFKAARELALQQPFWRQLSALCIEGLGTTLCQAVDDAWGSLDAMLDHWDELGELVGESVLISMKNWFGQPDNVTELERLMPLGFKFASKAATGPQPLAGKSFVITGALMSGQRDEVAEKIRKAGGTVKGSVSKKVNFVVQGVGGGRVKAEAAEKHGVPVITEEALYQMLGEAMPTANPRAHLEALRGD